MRQSDIIDAVRGIVIDASIDASPENYEVCHRFVTRSRSQGRGRVRRRDGRRGGNRRSRVPGHPRGCGATARPDRRGTPHGPARCAARRHSLGDLERDRRCGGLFDLAQRRRDPPPGAFLDAEAAAVVGDLIARTAAMLDRSRALEANLSTASTELSSLRGELEKARQESGSDALTALPNRRAFDSGLLDAVAVARTHRQPLSLGFCDVDHFKRFNDTWGHRLGDQVLRFVGTQMASEFGEVGLPARFGGEEFVVLLPNLGARDAIEAVQHFCDAVSARILRVRADNREVGRVTLSAGVATLRADESAEAFVARADAAMYAAKQAGRNRVLASA